MRGGIVLPSPQGPADQRLPDGRAFRSMAWSPGDVVDVGGQSLPAPRRASCTGLFSVGLGDASRQVALGGAAPDTALAWAADGRLAVGTARGEILVLDGWTGAVLARRQLSESLVKAVAWAPDGTVLYAGEQSPDALLHALDPATLSAVWTLRLADSVGTSPAPPGEDLYGVYTLPGVTGLVVRPDGALVVAATHAWNTESGRQNRSQVLWVASSGEVTATWPVVAADATLLHLAAHPDSDRVAVPVGRSADGPPPAGLPVGDVAVLRPGELVATVHTDPIAPWFEQTFVWQGLDVDARGLIVGYGDGRVRLADPTTGEITAAPAAGEPILAGDVPITAPVGQAALTKHWALAVTGPSNIPYGAAAPDLRPPLPHPGAHTLWAWHRDGTPAWTFNGPWTLQGLSVAPDDTWAVVGAAARETDRRRDLFGALVVDLDGEARTGEERLAAVCPTAGPVFFRHALHPDGRIAVAEVPWREGEDVYGAWRVTVLR